MSNTLNLKLRLWLQERTQQQRILILIGTMFVLLWIWFLLWENDYRTRYDAAVSQEKSLIADIQKTDQENESLKKILSSPEALRGHGLLKQQLAEANAQIQAFTTHLVSSSAMVNALEKILDENPELKLRGLKNEANFMITPPSAEPLKNIQLVKLYQHDFTLQFEGNYFATLTYLQKLEALPWQFYWDRIEYKVTKYPQAEVSIKLHTISHDEGLLDAQ